MSRALHLVVCAMNFWHSGGLFCDLEALRRKPNREHFVFYERVRLLIRSDWSAPETTSLPCAGRRFPELVARLSEISDALTKLGAGSNPYDKSFAGLEIDKKDDVHEMLQPYQDVDPDKIKLFGTGEWDPTPFLDDSLCLAFREPKILEHGLLVPPGPPVRDSAMTMAKLSQKWDGLGLLYLHSEEVHSDSLVRIFGALKDVNTHRQIGDKRGQNSREARLSGPSRDLPAACDLCELQINPSSESLVLSITDRKDFYHQLKVTRAKAISNTIGPAIPQSLLKDTKAYSAFMLSNSRRRYDRLRSGDKLGSGLVFREGFARPPNGHLWSSFKSVLQGDHTGVEIATASHLMLQEYGLLHESNRMCASRPLRSSKQSEGLVIDDFFSVSIQPSATPVQDTKAARDYATAQVAYEQQGLLGSPQKDIVASHSGKVIGGFVNGSPETLRLGVATVAAPPAKRLALSYIALQVAQLSHTTDALHLCLVGGFVSMLGFRRPMMSLLQRSFNLVDPEKYDKLHPKLIPLPREVASELALVATLVPLMLTDISVPFDSKVYSTDASSRKGAFLSAELGEVLPRVLWKTQRSKGAYTRLLTPLESILKNLGELEEQPSQPRVETPSRPLAYAFDFLEVFAGASIVTQYVAMHGISVGPPIDLDKSEEFDLASTVVVRWITHLIAEKLLWGFFLSPPCTTFSIMRRPRLRSKETPLGFSPREEKTQLGNLLACRAQQIMRCGAVNEAVGICETPYSSYMKHLPAWKSTSSLQEVSEVRCDSCRYGSEHLKSFRFQGLRVKMQELPKKCQCTSRHVLVEGSKTKQSATYVDGLADALGRVLSQAIRCAKRKTFETYDFKVKGLESQCVNEVALSAPWKLESCWTFRKPCHINILEESVLYRLCSWIAKGGAPKRLVVLVDSNVVRGATSKGRSSSRGLSPILRRLCSLCVAAAIYFTVCFVPTRLNVADDPTRDEPIRPPRKGLEVEAWSEEDLFKLCALPPLRRWASNWARLVLRSLGPVCLDFADRSLFRQSTILQQVPKNTDFSVFDFDSTLGFPGEGPDFPLPSCADLAVDFPIMLPASSPPCRLTFSHTGCFTTSRRAPFCVLPLGLLRPVFSLFGCLLWVCCLGQGAMAMPISARTPAELRKATERAARPEPTSTRPVTQATLAAREKHWDFFSSWCKQADIDLEFLMENTHSCVDEINCVLSRFGRELYKAGRTYNQYAETINKRTGG